MKSMTGFGRGMAKDTGGTQATVEIAAVNGRKQLDMRINAPREIGLTEPELRAIIQKRLVRGTLNVSISYQQGRDALEALSPIDEVYAKVVADKLTYFAARNGLQPPAMSDLLLVPGVLKPRDLPADSLKTLVLQALDKALDALDVMRTREGQALHDDLAARGENMKNLVTRIRAREPDVILTMKQKLLERIQALGIDLNFDDERLAREVAFYVDKTDITEELVRLESHLAQLHKLLQCDSDCGRNLDFLCQEMSREANTLSAKTADTVISQDAMALKIELYKVKEQIMNVE